MENDIDINELERLAKAATPGPWKLVGTVEQDGGTYRDIIPTSVSCGGWCQGGTPDRADECDLQYISAANPFSVLSLIDSLRKAKMRVQILERNLRDAEESGRRLAKQAHRAEQERDSLAAMLSELEGRDWHDPVAYIDNGTGRPHWCPGALPNSLPHGTKLYARPVPAEPVNVRLLEALKGLMALSDHRVDLRDQAKAARSAIAAAEAREMRDEYRSASCDDVARRVDECMTLRAERDALAAKLAELEGQEPTAWMNAKRDMASFIHFHEDDLPLFARPVPAEPVNVDFGKRGENMFFNIGNQSFLLDYKPEEQGEFEFMKAMLLSAFSRITHGVKTEIQPVDARLLNVSTGKLGHINAGLCPDSINGPDSRDPACPACRAIAEADADSKLACALHGTHGAGHETEWVKEQIHRQAESDVLSDLLGSLKEVCETFSSTNRLWKDTAVHVMAQRSIARAEAALSSSDDTPPSAEERRLRRMLCRQRHGLSAYMDDGEATFGGDEFQRPTDYLRESLDSIEQAWIEAGLKQAALAEPQPDADGWIRWGSFEVKLKSGASFVGNESDIIACRVAKP